MAKFMKVLEKEELESASGKAVLAEGKALAVFRIGEEYLALENKCLHRSGPLSEGELEGYEVICPWQGWTYDVRSGSFTIIPTLKVRTYKVEARDDGIYVEL